jgi:VanZ family protein
MPSSARISSTSSIAPSTRLPESPSRLDRARRWLPALAWAGLISFFSTGWFTGERTGAILLPLLAAFFPHASPAELHAWHMLIRKLAHFTEYLVLSVLLYQALRTGRRWQLRTALTALALAAAYSAADELHQTFVMGRTGAAGDSLVDMSGAAAGQALIYSTRDLVSGRIRRAGELLRWVVRRSCRGRRSRRGKLGERVRPESRP